ncbi:TldD/PmbA family protein [Paenibacillus endoradicis]|uniref:TldD/PmbA family protein n=1 Tax=Paenibacillus endoradicis TaxID=2972487 RepID=UPI0021590191|nr:TldD/PmbA family protein [Paenibacillus endoradicis]MCR8656788.1 TldD/PmbA family protein [Paenibacillus endoradicis]
MMNFDQFRAYIFEEAAQSGFTDCQLNYVTGTSTLMTIPSGEQYSIKTGVAFTGTKNGSSATAYSELLSEQSAHFLLAAVSNNIEAIGGKPYLYYDGSGQYETLQERDERIEDVELIKELHQNIVNEVNSYSNLQKTTGVLHANSCTIRIVNTKGLDVSHQMNYIYCTLYVVAEQDGQLKNSLIYRGGSTIEHIDVKGMVLSGYRKSSGYFGAEQVTTGTYNIMFPNDTASLFVQGISVFFSAASVLNNISNLNDKIQQKVAENCVTIIDDPHDYHGVFVWPFDTTGHPSTRKELVNKGILQTYLHDTETSQQFQDHQATGGNYWRLDYNYAPKVYPSNFSIAQGESSEEEMFAALGNGLYVTDVTAYFHGAGINAISGEYSIPATGFVVENGKIVRPFDGVTIAGNLYEFLQNIEMVGNDFIYGLPTSFRPGAPMAYGCYGSPSLLVKGITVSGK